MDESHYYTGNLIIFKLIYVREKLSDFKIAFRGSKVPLSLEMIGIVF